LPTLKKKFKIGKVLTLEKIRRMKKIKENSGKKAKHKEKKLNISKEDPKKLGGEVIKKLKSYPP
jgi:hypothetical protein